MTLREWLQIPCSANDLLPVPQERGGTGFYMPIVVVKRKIRLMETDFRTKLNQMEFRHLLFSNLKNETFASGSINLQMVAQGIKEGNYVPDPEITYLIGAATFNTQHYEQNGHWAATLKSLCIINALSDFPQFGSLANLELDKDVDAGSKGKKISAASERKIRNTLDTIKNKNA